MPKRILREDERAAVRSATSGKHGKARNDINSGSIQEQLVRWSPKKGSTLQCAARRQKKGFHNKFSESFVTRGQGRCGWQDDEAMETSWNRHNPES